MLRTHTAGQSNKNLVQQDEQRKKRMIQVIQGEKVSRGTEALPASRRGVQKAPQSRVEEPVYLKQRHSPLCEGKGSCAPGRTDAGGPHRARRSTKGHVWTRRRLTN